MLPDGFHWRSYLDGPALYLGGYVVAMLTPDESGLVRVDLNPGGRARWVEVLATESVARRFVETWARTLEATLRAEWVETAKGI